MVSKPRASEAEDVCYPARHCALKRHVFFKDPCVEDANCEKMTFLFIILLANRRIIAFAIHVFDRDHHGESKRKSEDRHPEVQPHFNCVASLPVSDGHAYEVG